MTIRHQIGSRIKELRKLAGYNSQDALGKDAGLGDGTVGYLERGETGPSVDNLKPLADALRCEVVDLFAYVESEFSPPSEIRDLKVQINDRLRGFDETQLRLIIDMLDAARDRLEIGATEQKRPSS